ncbi:uncharacterized protein Dwil_GK23996 [Drosophila willistoni]|uniref:UPAR/Ly6 domain-containing protein n=1 Tax=Drosophila willistoni TaxID=7260 RepID=B4MU79_DROWI|nr:uncharacterized protein LOC6641689 [Drosophila willistoni]EDW75668.1 uncharacterized protein Dwil_GK23996 [Drosophila willistoni]
MWKKVILVAVLVAFISVQFADSLICYSCNSPDSCRSPSSHVCSNTTANASSTFLKTIHSNVPEIAGSSYFLCSNLVYTHSENQSQAAAFQGCVHPNATVCNLTLNATNSNNWNRTCSTCFDKDYCNPAGTFSGSFYTIVGSVLALLMAKLVY